MLPLTIFWSEIVSVIERGALKTSCIQNWGILESKRYIQYAKYKNRTYNFLIFLQARRKVIVNFKQPIHTDCVIALN